MNRMRGQIRTITTICYCNRMISSKIGTPVHIIHAHDGKVNFEDTGMRSFQTCNDLVMCATQDYCKLFGIHRIPAGFQCMYSSDTKVEYYPHSVLASDGLVVAIVPQSPSAKCYSWNHDTAQFHSEYSADGRLFACWSELSRSSLGHADQLVGKFPTFWPSHFKIPLATDSSFFGIAREAQ